jgi:hypothetical protein
MEAYVALPSKQPGGCSRASVRVGSGTYNIKISERAQATIAHGRHMLLEFRAAKHYNRLLWRKLESFSRGSSVKTVRQSFPTLVTRLPALD